MNGLRGAPGPDPLPETSAHLGEGEGSSGRVGSGRRASRPRGTAPDRALNLLSFRDRSWRELEQRLLRAGFERDEVDEALDGLARAGLIDDDRYARAVVEQEIGLRGSGKRAAMTRLMRSGVSRDQAERAIEEAAADGDEEGRAFELANRRADRLRGLDPAVAHRRLMSFLARRGYEPSVARRAASRALAGPIDPDS